MAERFVSFYESAMLGFARWRDLDSLNLFFAICKHANPFGWSDPSDDLLGMESGHRRDAIPALLGQLQAAELIHVTQTIVPFRQKPLRGFQVNPCVIRLRDENHASAMADWLRYTPQTNAPNEKQTTPITYGENDLQPESESEPAFKPESQPESKPQSNQRETSREAADQESLEGERQKQEPKQDEKQGVAQRSLSTRSETTSHASAIPPSAPREPRSLQRYKTPLPDITDEEMAMELVNLTGDLSRENARMLVDTYSYECAVRASVLYRQQAGIVQHPGRWIRTMLRKGADELWKEQPLDHYKAYPDDVLPYPSQRFADTGD